MTERKSSPAPDKSKKNDAKKVDAPTPATSGDFKEVKTPAGLPVTKVVVHPLVLLSVVDHFHRVSKNDRIGRVVGILLGSQREDKVVDVSNSFAVPFDESDPKVWFLDHEYLDNMYAMFKKVNAREKIVGWYHTGPKLSPNDISINEVIKRYAPNSVLVIVDVQLKKDTDLPTEAYIEIEEVHDDGTPPSRTFEHVASEMGAEEAEEVGVEHLLRDIKDQTAGTLSQRITDKHVASRGMEQNLAHIDSYLKQVSDGKLPVNHSLNYLLQDLLNLLPDTQFPEFVRSANVQLNDDMLAMYTSSLARSIIALNNLINNKISLLDTEKADAEKSKVDAVKKDKDELIVALGDKKKNEENVNKKNDKK